MADRRVGVIGLGDMGAALAGALLEAGFPTCVWNRSVEKARPSVDAGAVLAKSPADAAAQSDVLVVCVSTYEVSDSLLRDPEAGSRLAGKTIVQLTTGTPEQGREARAWADALGVEYLDGSIMAFPSQIGTDEALILVGGSQSSYENTREVFEALAKHVVYLGSDAGHGLRGPRQARRVSRERCGPCRRSRSRTPPGHARLDRGRRQRSEGV
jgi:3-hydroxyisobutyrate dehydrogenase-like beta-hydroxyacid dehydrogenase